jgi:hypothetical protein
MGAILLPFVSLFMVWAIQRGLNITDESMYLLSSQYPDDVKFGLTSYHLYTSFFFHSVGQNIIALRFVQLVMTIFSGTVFYIGLNRFISQYQIKTHKYFFDKASAISFMCLGAMFAYFWFLPSPSYNSLNSFTLIVSSGLFLSLHVESEKTSDGPTLKSWFILFLIGLCIGLSFFVKFTTGILLFLLYGAFISIIAKQGIKNKVQYLLIIITGISIWMFLHFIFIQSPVLWWRYFSNGLQLVAAMSAGYNASSLNRYFHEVVMLGKSALKDFWALHVMILSGLSFIYHFKKSSKNNVQLISALFGVVFAAAVALSISRHLHVGGQSQTFNLSRFYLSWLLLLLSAVIASFGYNIINGSIIPKQKLSELLLVGILLFSLPFAGAIGTGAPIYLGVLMHMAPWFGLMLLLATLLSWLHRIQWIAPVVCVLFSLFACAQIVTGCLFDPYQLLTGLSGQTQATEIGYPSTTLKLDPITSEYFMQIKALAQKNGFKPGNDVVALYDLPGVVFALGARSPALPWYIGNPRKSPAAAAEKALSIADQERLKHAFILQTSKSDRIMPDLGKFGLSFPSGYMLCGEVNNPYDSSKGTVRLWKPL